MNRRKIKTKLMTNNNKKNPNISLQENETDFRKVP